MSAIKQHYHEQINRKDDLIDDEYCYSQWLASQKEEDSQIEKEAEKAEFFRIFEATGTYPF